MKNLTQQAQPLFVTSAARSSNSPSTAFPQAGLSGRPGGTSVDWGGGGVGIKTSKGIHGPPCCQTEGGAGLGVGGALGGWRRSSPGQTEPTRGAVQLPRERGAALFQLPLRRLLHKSCGAEAKFASCPSKRDTGKDRAREIFLKKAAVPQGLSESNPSKGLSGNDLENPSVRNAHFKDLAHRRGIGGRTWRGTGSPAGLAGGCYFFGGLRTRRTEGLFPLRAARSRMLGTLSQRGGW